MDINRISCCSYPMRDKEPEHVFRALSQAGYRKVDLWGRLPHFDVTDPSYDFDAVMKLSERYGVRIANIGSYCGGGFASDDEAEREKELADTRKVLDAAARCGARSVRSVLGRPEAPELLDRILPYYQRAAEYAEQKGIYMGVENHGGPVSGNPELLAEFFSRVGSKYTGVLYEPCNLMVAGVDYKQAFDTMKDHITHMHIKDCYPIEGKMRVVWLGTGLIDYRWVVASLEGIGYTGDYPIEYEVHDEPPEQGIGKWLDWFLKV
ncbi:MAG: sugar phosphate isomerase/epimerase [Anaerolineae bacterium]|nr:sugar phosphate isomerase/epimerase [Anaerolineae bacterium]